MTLLELIYQDDVPEEFSIAKLLGKEIYEGIKDKDALVNLRVAALIANENGILRSATLEDCTNDTLKGMYLHTKDGITVDRALVQYKLKGDKDYRSSVSKLGLKRYFQ